MRANGVDERYCTGDAAPDEKFQAWARTVPHTLRNPLYHWTHLELKRYFGIDELLDESSAPRIWEQANAPLATAGAARARHPRQVPREGGLHDRRSDGRSAPATRPSRRRGLATKVFPTFRPDKALNVHLPGAVQSLGGAAGGGERTSSIAQLPDFIDALRQRHDFFHQMGGRLSDHGLNHAYRRFRDRRRGRRDFRHARARAKPRRPRSTAGSPPT